MVTKDDNALVDAATNQSEAERYLDAETQANRLIGVEFET